MEGTNGNMMDAAEETTRANPEVESTITNPVRETTKTTAATVIGRVKSFDRGRRFGFIAQEGMGKDVFVHQEAILGEEGQYLIPGDRVSFELTEGPKGPRAASVRKL